ncbi:beta family protein [Pectobacterium versatile]|uniref:beta family protein n=1 Tax=Pectobacterium versatile TaxID=2488639 RepID=UPI001CF23FAD|nr:beta family protein [Pectobacterium versatile]MCA6926521.1 beta family protein [Pectobacterium versatile]MCH5083271.1 beta family protein [Pectobacterium versatile]
MYPTYVPILRAKAGEFKALKKLEVNYSEKIWPFFEIPQLTDDAKDLKALRGSVQLTQDFLNLVANGIRDANSSPSIFFDLFDWKADSYVETGEHILSYMYRALAASGVIVHPVIGFDRWDILDYRSALKGLDIPDGTMFCLRIDSTSIDDAYDVDYFTETIHDILDSLGLSGDEVMVMFDFGDVTHKSIVSMHADMQHLIAAVDEFGFACIMLAGCSFPMMINDAVKDVDSTAFVERKEMHVWKAMYPDIQKPFIFVDYGIRNPKGGDGIKAVHANGKIRYTIKNKYFVARGHSKQKGNKGAQMYDLARAIVNSPHYLGAKFSWGDECIEACSREKIKGGPTQWISYDTNHHVTFVVEEVLEFQRIRVVPRTTTA